MPSLIPGYEYDIFISYRQKDNKGDKWVSRFVDALKTELESTFKEDISVYFDENPHDRLQETHNVDKSLEGKLKCVIFIPILSQTYCDPNSYAWQYEFLAFLSMAKNDHVGKDVRLRSGNVTSRILPIRIHDLEPEDVKLFEKETGSVLRALDFVFKTSTGVSRPLKDNEDHPQDNLNKTFYSDQINKVGHAIKEIILGVKKEPEKVVKEIEKSNLGPTEAGNLIPENSPKPGKQKFIRIAAIVAVLVIIAIFAYPKIFKRDALEKLKSSGERISVAVMPFQNMTNDTTWNVWQNGVQEILTSSLSTSLKLRICNTESIKSSIKGKGLANYASITPAHASKISQMLDADVYVLGKLIQAGSTLRVTAQLIKSKTGEILKPFQIEDSSNSVNILKIVDLLSEEIKNFLTVSQLKQNELRDFQQYEITNSPEAYRNYLAGMNSFGKMDFSTAREYFTLTMQYDSNFTLAALLLSQTDLNLQLYEEAKEYCIKAYKKRDHMSMYMKCKINDIYAWCTEGPQGRIKYLRQLLDLDDQDPITYYHLGNSYFNLHQYDRAIPEFEKSLDIYKRWGVKPSWVFCYNQLGLAYHQEGLYKKEKKLYHKAEKDFPNHGGITRRQAVLFLSEGDSPVAEKYIEKYISILKDNSLSEAIIKNNLGAIYSQAGILNKAEEYYRQALLLESNNTGIMNDLGYFLIDKGQKIDEGIILVERALVINPASYNSLHYKGWGLYKQGKYKEALEILQKSWDLRMKNAIYNHEAFLHLEAAKKAVEGLK